MLGTILIILLILLLIGALPRWGYSGNWEYGPSGLLGLILIIIVVLVAARPHLGVRRGRSSACRSAPAERGRRRSINSSITQRSIAPPAAPASGALKIAPAMASTQAPSMSAQDHQLSVDPAPRMRARRRALPKGRRIVRAFSADRNGIKGSFPAEPARSYQPCCTRGDDKRPRTSMPLRQRPESPAQNQSCANCWRQDTEPRSRDWRQC